MSWHVKQEHPRGCFFFLLFTRLDVVTKSSGWRWGNATAYMPVLSKLEWLLSKSYSLKNVTPPVTVKTRKWEFYDWLVGSALSSEAKNDGSCLTQITSITLVVIDAPPPAWQNKPFVFLINCRSIVILRARWCSKLKIKNGWGFNYVNNKTRGRFFCCSCFFLY
jgi:hypothetical protein